MFRSSEEVLHVLSSILGCLQRGRSSLVVPRKRTIDDLMKSRNMVRFFSGVLLFHVYIVPNTLSTMLLEA